MIATITADHPFDWEEALPKVCIAYDTSIHMYNWLFPILFNVWERTSIAN